MITRNVSQIARIAAVAAFGLLAAARPAAAQSAAQGFQPIGGLATVQSSPITQPMMGRTAGTDNVNVHPTRAWTANSRGYRQSSFRRGERILFSFSSNSNRTRSARVTMTVRQSIWCFAAPCPDHRQVIYDGWVTFPAGSSSKYVPMVTTSADPKGGWEYWVTIDENGRAGDGDDETVSTTFELR